MQGGIMRSRPSLTVYMIAGIDLGIVRQLLGVRFVPECRGLPILQSRDTTIRNNHIACETVLRKGLVKRMSCPWMVFFVAGLLHAFSSFFDSLHYSTY